MKFKLNKIFITIAFTATLVCLSCDDMLDINDDPNNPATSTPTLTLPVAQVALAARLESDYNLLGSMLAHYWTTGPTAAQYSNIDRYDITTNNYSATWTFVYSTVLSDLEYVKDRSLANEQYDYAAIAQLLQAYTFQILVDLYDKVPYSEALKGIEEGNLTPRFEDGPAIYDSLINDIDQAIAWIETPTDAVAPGVDDLIYGGRMNLWEKFANTLKLKIYIRQAFVRPNVAQAGIEALLSADAPLLAPGEDARVTFSTATHNQNSLWQELDQTSFSNLVASNTTLDTLIAVNDTRIDELYDESPEGNGFVGLVQGIGTRDGGVFADYARPNSTFIINPTAATYLMTGYESLFLQAEAAARGWSDGDAVNLYNEAVLASFNFWGEEGDSFIAPGGDYEYQDINSIYYQKWLAFNGKQGFEGWTEWRRTGVPSLDVSVQGRPLPNTFPLRLVWPISERSANPNVPELETIDTPVWWDTTY